MMKERWRRNEELECVAMVVREYVLMKRQHENISYITGMQIKV